MSELNDSQKELAEFIDGMAVVDAGPGTGKTHTIVERYLRLVGKKIDPLKILMLTFTKNAAQEMKDRISAGILAASAETTDENEKDRLNKSIKNIKTSTFDAFCLNIVLNSPESICDFFDIKEMLSRNAHLIENKTLNSEYFANFYARFVNDHGKRYIKNEQNAAALASISVDNIQKIIDKLMSCGVIPLKYDWFEKGADIVKGNTKTVLKNLKTDEKTVIDEFKKMLKTPELYNLPDLDGWTPESKMPLPETILEQIADENRYMLLEFIHDVYYQYIRKSIIDNRLTFGLCELFAFAILYSDPRARNMHSVEYMMVDEFQDTNELQLKICLLLLKKPNLCVVGDWKQGIYGFRYASKENIIDFEDRVDLFITRLNKGETRVPFKMQNPKSITLTENYRSSSLILENAFHALEIPGNKTEVVNTENICKLNSNRDEEIGTNTEFEIISAKDKESEVAAVVSKIIEYRRSGKYKIIEKGIERNVSYKDIAILCRSGNYCRLILDQCEKENVPAFFQGDLEIMCTREGKLALAWLRYVNNSNDQRGLVAILVDRGYSLSEIIKMIPDKKSNPEMREEIPIDIKDQLERLRKKRRRPNDLLTSIFAFYNLDNDITQTIINIISSAYGNSLLTISDLIRLIEEDIKKSTKYDVDPSLEIEAVTIQTMHKSKGLEYPIVIIAGMNNRTMPIIPSNKDSFIFDEIRGIRCTKEFFSKENDGVVHEKILDSWRYKLIKTTTPTDYSEERRVLFVAMSRAKQYLTMSYFNPSLFIEGYGIANAHPMTRFEETEIKEDRPLSPIPEIAEYDRRRKSLSPHDLMGTFKDSPQEGDEAGGKGAEYGKKVHEAAYRCFIGKSYDELPEMENVKKILKSVEGANKVSAECRCILPIGNVSIKGIIDLIAEFDDRVEIHDYKTDDTHKYLESYIFQLSIYAHAAEALGKKNIKCFLDFVSITDKPMEITPISLEQIKKVADDYNKYIARDSYPDA